MCIKHIFQSLLKVLFTLLPAGIKWCCPRKLISRCLMVLYLEVLKLLTNIPLNWLHAAIFVSNRHKRDKKSYPMRLFVTVWYVLVDMYIWGSWTEGSAKANQQIESQTDSGKELHWPCEWGQLKKSELVEFHLIWGVSLKEF